VRPRGESFFSTPFVLSSTLTAARTLTHTRTHSTRARARTRVHTLTDTRHRHTLHTRNRTRPNARARTERSFSLSLSLQPSLNGYVPSPSKLCPPSLPPPPPLLPPTTVHSRPLFPLLLFFFVSLFRPSFALSPSHRRCWRCPCTLSTCPTFDVSPSEQRGRHEGSLAGNARLKAFVLARVSHVGTLDESTLKTHACTSYPRVSLRRAYFVSRKRLSSVPTIAISRADANRYCIATRQSFAQRSPRKLVTGYPAIPHSRSATRTNPRHSVDYPAPCKAASRFRVRAKTGGATIPRGFRLVGGIEVTLRPPLVTTVANGIVTGVRVTIFFFPFENASLPVTTVSPRRAGRDQCSVQGS